MKTIRRILMLLLAVVITCTACKDELPSNLPGSVQFSLGELNSGNRGAAAQESELSDARALVVTIKDDQGNLVYDQEQIEVFNFSGTMVGAPLSLNPGSYQLTEFLVLDEQGNVIFATPLEGAEYAYLVNDPLPIDFAVITDETTTVVPEVIRTAEFTPEDFGYVSFRFTLVEHFNFLIAAFSFDHVGQNLDPTTAQLKVFDQASGAELYTTTLGANTNSVAIKDGYDYRLLVEKSGYVSVEINYSNGELKGYSNNPLEVVLQLNNAAPSTSFSNSGQAFSIELGTSVNTGDLDGDGDLDLFVTRTNGHPTEVLMNDGSGNYSSGDNLGALNVIDAALGDLDGDGDLDVFMVQWSEQPNLVWFNDGDGNFTNSGQTLGNSATSRVELADLDNDGDLDAIVVDYYNLPILINDGTGIFTQAGLITGSMEANDISIGDLNGDGSLDVFVANSYPTSGLADLVYFNDGSANFTDSGQALGNERSLRVKLADLDGDSDLDAFIGGHDQGSTVWLNNGSGIFTNSGQSLSSLRVKEIVVKDFDLDGDLDFFTVSDNNQPHLLYWNNGTGNLTNSGIVFGNYSSGSATSGDFDGDGDIDLFVTNGNFVSDVLWLGGQN
jgi:hypothetical protein